MKRAGYAVLLSVVVVGLWFGSREQSGGQGQSVPLLDQRFCADVNGDGKLDVSDAVTILLYLFRGRAAPYCVAQNISLGDLVPTPEEKEILGHMTIVDLPVDDDGTAVKTIRFTGVNV